MDLEEFAWLDASKFTQESEKRQVLRWFVDRVRASKKVNPSVLEFIADGVAEHLAGRKPWAGRRGKKKRHPVEAMFDAYRICAVVRRIEDEGKGLDLVQIAEKRSGRGPLSEAQVTAEAAKELGISEDTVERAIGTVENVRDASPSFEDYLRVDEFLRFRGWLDSPAGKKWRETRTK